MTLLNFRLLFSNHLHTSKIVIRLSIIESCLYLEPTVAYERAKRLLQENYGNPIPIANLYMEKLRQWPRIFENDGKGIREFPHYLIVPKILSCFQSE